MLVKVSAPAEGVHHDSGYVVFRTAAYFFGVVMWTVKITIRFCLFIGERIVEYGPYVMNQLGGARGLITKLAALYSLYITYRTNAYIRVARKLWSFGIVLLNLLYLFLAKK